MTTFFNKKEEVLDLQLTEYGKSLLAKGRLKPTHYAFFDDDILYNTKYAPSDPTITGVEERVNTFHGQVRDSLTTLDIKANDPNIAAAFDHEVFGEKINFMSEPIGTSGLDSFKAPAWSVSMLTNEISSSTEYVTVREHQYIDKTQAQRATGGVVQQIPQLDIEVDYKTFFREGELLSDAVSMHLFSEDTPGSLDATNIYLALKEDYILMDIMEDNTYYEKENFTVEVFHSSSQPGNLNPYTPLSYISNTSVSTEALDGMELQSG